MIQQFVNHYALVAAVNYLCLVWQMLVFTL